MLVWVPLQLITGALDGIDGITVEVVNPDDGADLPPSASEVAFYVPPPFPSLPAVAALASMPSLKVVQTLTAGIDLFRPHIPAGVVLCNARGVHDASTAEWVLAAILSAIRQFPYFAAEQAAGRWSSKFTGSLAGQTVLIVGHGSIGRAVERRLAGFEARIVRVARSARDGVHPVTELPELLPLADVVVVLTPVTSATIGMVNAGFLAAMKDGALLVNGARGTLVVTDDLCAELSTGRLNAALDVTDPEPLPAGHPLWAMPNALITPHVAASTSYSALPRSRSCASRWCAGWRTVRSLTSSLANTELLLTSLAARPAPAAVRGRTAHSGGRSRPGRLQRATAGKWREPDGQPGRRAGELREEIAQREAWLESDVAAYMRVVVDPGRGGVGGTPAAG